MKIFIVTLSFVMLLALQLERCDALTCPRCTSFYKDQNCKPKDDCPYGTSQDNCNCCQWCAKGENDECGGLWNVRGYCSEQLNLICDPHKTNRMAPGKCIKNETIAENP